MVGHAPCEQPAERAGGLVVEHRRPGLGIDQVQSKP